MNIILTTKWVSSLEKDCQTVFMYADLGPHYKHKMMQHWLKFKA